jgi:dual specificity phosphatase 3
MNARKSDPVGETATAQRNVAANISYVTGRVWTGGDLPFHLGEEAMLADLVAIQNAGITDILDNRIEWSDAEFVAAHAPDMYYLWNGADDAGQAMPDQWFFDGVDFALTALEDPGAQVLAHCHMGINRGPSMAFAILLATGMDPVEALTAIRAARPIAAISYAGDALSWWHRMTKTPASIAKRQRAEVATWHRRNPLDVVRIIRTIRSHEDASQQLPA